MDSEHTERRGVQTILYPDEVAGAEMIIYADTDLT